MDNGWILDDVLRHAGMFAYQQYSRWPLGVAVVTRQLQNTSAYISGSGSVVVCELQW